MWSKKWVNDFNSGKSQHVSSGHSSNVALKKFIKCGTTEVKMDESNFDENSSFKMMRLSFSFTLD